MPYRLRGKDILVFKNGEWQVKYTHPTAKKALAQFRALEINDPHAHDPTPSEKPE